MLAVRMPGDRGSSLRSDDQHSTFGFYIFHAVFERTFACDSPSDPSFSASFLIILVFQLCKASFCLVVGCHRSGEA